ncbi:MAG: hypothetical protein CMM50_03840 [Rhodospirillaceae bacterium]|nr:hypothetical protein [Rhodospirillaceae bacterium]
MTLAIIAISVPMTTWAMALHVRGAVVRRRKRKAVSRMMAAYRPMPSPCRQSQWAWMRWGGPRRVEPEFALETMIARMATPILAALVRGRAGWVETREAIRVFLYPPRPRKVSFATVAKFAAALPGVLTMLAPV